MSKALIVFGSTTGNTETVADTVEKAMKDGGFEVDCKNATDVKQLVPDYVRYQLNSYPIGYPRRLVYTLKLLF